MQIPAVPRKLYWPNIIFLTLTPLATVILVPWHWYHYGFSWVTWLLFLISCAVTNLAITAGYHRYFAHRSYHSSELLKWLYLLLGASAFQGSALKWATDHRRHHRFVDTPEDPYSIKEGFFYAHLGWLLVEDDPRFKDQWSPDLRRDKAVYWQHKYYIPLATAMGFGLPTLIGWTLGDAWAGLIYGGAFRLVVTNHCTFFINSLCHYIGGQPYTDQNSAKDSFIMAFLATGEGYHNFHHKFQADYRNGIKWYHWDPTKWLLNVLSWFGMVRNLKKTPQTQIYLARLAMDEKRLLESGISAELLHPFRAKVEQAQAKIRTLHSDYLRMKENVRERSSVKMKNLRQEIRHAQREFKTAWADWRFVRRRPRLALIRAGAGSSRR